MASKIDDATLIESCRNGDAKAWEEIVSRYSGRLKGVAVARCGLSGPDAEDLVQNVFMRLLEWIEKIEVTHDKSLGGFLKTTMVNMAIDRHRSHKAQKRGGEAHTESLDDTFDDDAPRHVAADHSTPEKTLLKKESFLFMKESFQMLNQRCRSALDLRYVQELDYDAIAQQIESTVNAAYGIIHRCLKELRVLYVSLSEVE